MPDPLDKQKGFNSKLSTKMCMACLRPFQYRKKWKEEWNDVKYCSQKCKKSVSPTKKPTLNPTRKIPSLAKVVKG
jgi:hypothetical protein